MAKKRIVMAIGHKDMETNLPEQKEAVKRTAKVIADFIQDGWQVAIVHSNAPQVGMIHTAMNEFGKQHHGYSSAPMSVCSAMSQGYIGYDLQNGIRAELTMLYPASDSVRQALAEDTKNQLTELGIEVTTEGVDWDTAYTRAESEPLVWGWGAHTPMELYNIYHTMSETGLAEYSPYANETVDKYMDEALAASDLESSYDLWKKAQWDGENGVTQDGDIPWIWLVNIDHLYWSRNGLHVADQKLHPHGHGWSIVNNVDQWTWE